MTDLYILHIHNSANEVYNPHFNLSDAIDGMIEYVVYWWDEEMGGEGLPDPLTREDVEFYWSDTGEYSNIVHIYAVGTELKSEVVDPEEIWRVYLQA